MEKMLGSVGGDTMGDLAEAAVSGFDPGALMRRAAGAIKGAQPKLSPRMIERLYSLNREVDPAEVQRLLEQSFVPRSFGSMAAPAILGAGLGGYSAGGF
jgi:hypothetical protein